MAGPILPSWVSHPVQQPQHVGAGEGHGQRYQQVREYGHDGERNVDQHGDQAAPEQGRQDPDGQRLPHPERRPAVAEIYRRRGRGGGWSRSEGSRLLKGRSLGRSRRQSGGGLPVERWQLLVMPVERVCGRPGARAVAVVGSRRLDRLTASVSAAVVRSRPRALRRKALAEQRGHDLSRLGGRHFDPQGGHSVGDGVLQRGEHLHGEDQPGPHCFGRGQLAVLIGAVDPVDLATDAEAESDVVVFDQGEASVLLHHWRDLESCRWRVHQMQRISE